VERFIILAVVGLVAQLVDGSLGMAYGATSSTLLLTFGLSPASASASVHLAEVVTTLLSGASHWRFGNVDWRTVRRIGVSGAIGAFAGAYVLTSLSTEVAKPWMAGILLAIGAYVLVRFSLGGTPRRRGKPYVRGRYLVPLGLTAGFIDATGGGGWGPVATPTLLATGKMPPRKVIGSVDTSEFLVSVAASIGFLLSLGTQGISWQAVGALLAGGIIAAPIAAWLVRKIVPRILGAAVGGFIVIINTRTLLGELDVSEADRAPYYVGLFLLWGLAIFLAHRWHRREDRTAWGDVEHASPAKDTDEPAQREAEVTVS
jgi:uncharacterized membrane protein YfcA